MEIKNILNNISIIGIEPQTPANIGAICRACNVMGLTDIRLINPAPFQNTEAEWIAWGSQDLLKTIQIKTCLEDALHDQHIVIGTTHKKRKNQIPYHTPNEIVAHLLPLLSTHKVAFIFGRESTGIHQEELERCDYLASIPVNTDYPSINLSHAVMIFTYEIYQQALLYTKSLQNQKEKYQWNLATSDQKQALYTRLDAVIKLLPLTQKDSHLQLSKLFLRVFGRSDLEIRDVKLFHKLFDLITFGVKK